MRERALTRTHTHTHAQVLYIVQAYHGVQVKDVYPAELSEAVKTQHNGAHLLQQRTKVKHSIRYNV